MNEKELLFERAHFLLHRVLNLIPAAHSVLIQVLKTQFPHTSESTICNLDYIQNLIKVIDYASVLRGQILTLIIDQTLQIDVQIQVEMDELDDDEHDEIEEALFSQFGENSYPESSQVPQEEDESEDEVSTTIFVNVRSMVQKLDSILHLLMHYIKTLNPLELEETFHVMLRIFECLVLPTHRSRYTQFLWFYLCSLESSFPDIFLGMLVTKTFDISCPDIVRISAVSYISSYIARAKYIQTLSVGTCLQLLNQWAIQYVEKEELMFKVRDLKRHGFFYGVIQSMLYIFCFRWKDLMLDKDGNRVITTGFPTELEHFDKAITCHLMPLKVKRFFFNF